MKDFAGLLALVAIAALGVGWYLLPRSGGPRGPQLKPGVESTKSPATEQKSLPAKRAPKVREAANAGKKLTAAQVPPSPATAPQLDIPTAPAEPKPTQLPMPVAVPAGEDRQQIVAGYGVPTLAAATQDQGHLFETYVYRRDRTQTNILLEDGRVTWVVLRNPPEHTKTAQPMVPLHALRSNASEDGSSSGQVSGTEAAAGRSSAPGAAPAVTVTSGASAGKADGKGGAGTTAVADLISGGVLTVTSEPSGASVEINQVPAGSTPLTLRLSPGGLGFTVTVSKSGFLKWTVQTVVTAKPMAVHARLTPAPSL